jgi:hypothetical protein
MTPSSSLTETCAAPTPDDRVVGTERGLCGHPRRMTASSSLNETRVIHYRALHPAWRDQTG